MDSEAVRCASFPKLPEEYHLGTDFLDGDMEILYTLVTLFQVVEFVVVGREKGLGAVAVFMDVFDYRPRDGHSVVGRSSPADLVQEHQGPGAQVVEDHRCLEHLDHERGFSAGNVVGSAYPCEYLVHIADPRAFSGDEASRLGQKHYEGGLAEEG